VVAHWASATLSYQPRWGVTIGERLDSDCRRAASAGALVAGSLVVNLEAGHPLRPFRAEVSDGGSVGVQPTAAYGNVVRVGVTIATDLEQ